MLEEVDEVSMVYVPDVCLRRRDTNRIVRNRPRAVALYFFLVLLVLRFFLLLCLLFAGLYLFLGLSVSFDPSFLLHVAAPETRPETTKSSKTVLSRWTLAQVHKQMHAQNGVHIGTRREKLPLESRAHCVPQARSVPDLVLDSLALETFSRSVPE